jgi:hypothetical protein
MDIAEAYPQAAGIKSYRREFIFRPGEGLTLKAGKKTGGIRLRFTRAS